MSFVFQEQRLNMGGQYTRFRALSMEHVEILIEIAIGIAIVIEIFKSSTPNPISMAIP